MLRLHSHLSLKIHNCIETVCGRSYKNNRNSQCTDSLKNELWFKVSKLYTSSKYRQSGQIQDAKFCTNFQFHSKWNREHFEKTTSFSAKTNVSKINSVYLVFKILLQSCSESLVLSIILVVVIPISIKLQFKSANIYFF